MRRNQPHEQVVAHAAVHHAIRSGRLPLPTQCAICHRTQEDLRLPGNHRRIHYHHWNGYDVAAHLDVIPLCASDHRKVHRGIIAADVVDHALRLWAAAKGAA